MPSWVMYLEVTLIVIAFGLGVSLLRDRYREKRADRRMAEQPPALRARQILDQRSDD